MMLTAARMATAGVTRCVARSHEPLHPPHPTKIGGSVTATSGNERLSVLMAPPTSFWSRCTDQECNSLSSWAAVNGDKGNERIYALECDDESQSVSDLFRTRHWSLQLRNSRDVGNLSANARCGSGTGSRILVEACGVLHRGCIYKITLISATRLHDGIVLHR
jgi:hypothetical protein